MNKPLRNNPVVIHGGGLVCPRGKNLHAAALRCQEEAPHLLPSEPSTTPKHAFLFESMIDALNDLVAGGLPRRIPECTVVLVAPDQLTFDREIAPFYKPLREAIGLRLGVTSPNLSYTLGTNPAAGVLLTVIESLRAVRGNAPVLILGAQPERRPPNYPAEQCTEHAAIALLLGDEPRQPVYVEVAGFSTAQPQPFEQLLASTIACAVHASGTAMKDIGHVVLDEGNGNLLRGQLQTAAHTQSSTGAWAGNIWNPADVFGNTGAVSGFVSFLIAYDITVHGWPGMQGLWVSGEGAEPKAIVLRRKGPVVR